MSQDSAERDLTDLARVRVSARADQSPVSSLLASVRFLICGLEAFWQRVLCLQRELGRRLYII